MATIKIPIYKAKVSDTDDTGIFAMSFVDYPANESNFVALSKQYPVQLSVDKPKQILTGAVLIPDQLIYRNDAKLGEYYLTFTAEDIERIALKAMRTKVALSTTTHQHEKPLQGNYLVEWWTVRDPKRDKSAALGLGEYPAGTLMASYKVEDRDYWRKEVLSGNVKGFSLEGIFNYNNINMSKAQKTAAQLAKEKAAAAKNKGKGIPAFFRSIAALLEGETEVAAEDLVDEAAKDETDSGTPFIVFELAEGGEVWVDEEGYATRDGEPMPAGEHALADGNFISIDENGQLVITQPEADTEEPEEAAVTLAKQRAKAFFKHQDTTASKIAALEKEIAALKKQPSAPKATPPVDSTKKTDDLTYTEKLARVVRNRQEREKK